MNWASLIAELVKNPPAMQETLVWFLGWEDPLEKRDRLPTPIFLGFPCGSAGKESAHQSRGWRFDPWLGEDPLGMKWQPNPVFLPGKSCGQRSLVGCSPWGCKASDVTKWLSTAQRGVRVLTEVNSSAMSFSGPPLVFLRAAQQVKGCMLLLCSLESFMARQAKGTVCRLLRNVPKAWIHFPHLLQGSL